MAAAAALVLGTAPLLGGTGAHADGAPPSSYSLTAQAPVAQMTYDFPTANFHPQADSELTYAMAAVDTTRAHALSSHAWPGAAGGNLGSLIGVLGGPTIDALNDPVRAEASTGGSTDQTTGTPTGTEMHASVVPAGGFTQEAEALTTSAALPMGQGGSIGSSAAHATSTVDSTGALVATATTEASNIDIAGVFKAASLTSSATDKSAGGATPTGSNQITVHNLTIAGQPAYVDGSGVHVGQPGQPGNPEINGIVNQVLTNAGMSIYFTAPQHVTIASVNYEYAASILIYWAPPHDPNGDTFTWSFGGSAVAMDVTAGTSSSTPDTSAAVPPASTGGTDTGATAIPVSPATPSLALPSTPSSPPPPAPVAAAPGPASVQLASPAAFHTRGVGAPWFVLLGLVALAGMFLLPRLPGLLSASAAAACPRENLSGPSPKGS